jgi:hypothetical protein
VVSPGVKANSTPILAIYPGDGTVNFIPAKLQFALLHRMLYHQAINDFL